ncbi:MAG: GntR family transcriptional regulator [Proteobacteria bacterium]|nr:GntR family transcriptional regulator [Pseudomonadota bacterium]
MDHDANIKIIDRNSYEPAYMQLVRIVSEQIATGVVRSGDQLPAEAQFCAQYNISPMTVRRAINILVERGLVSATQGKGTFVRSLDIGEAVFRLQELKNNWAQGSLTTVRLLEASIVSADERVARKLAIAPGERTIYMRRIVLNEDAPTMYHREYVVYDPRRPLVEAQLQITLLEGLLQGQSSGGLRRGHLTIEPVNIREEEALQLKVPVGTAAFYLEHFFYDFHDQLVSWGGFICRADHFKLTTFIGAGADL